MPDIVDWVRTRLALDPDEPQAKVLRAFTTQPGTQQCNAKQGILNCTRQWGKSLLGAIMAVHHACANAGTLTLIASPGERQSVLLLDAVADLLRRLGIRRKSAGGVDHSLLLPNRSRIVALPGVEATARGFSAVSMLLIDEAAQVSDSAYKTLRPMLATVDGALWLLSTPFGKRGFFWEEWTHGGPDWFRISVPATGCSRIRNSWLERERRAHGSAWFQQEYMCAFVDNGETVFGRDLVEEAFDATIEELTLD